MSEPKPRMVEVVDSWTLRVLEANQGDLGCPRLIDGRYVDAGQFTAWKARKWAPPKGSENDGEAEQW